MASFSQPASVSRSSPVCTHGPVGAGPNYHSRNQMAYQDTSSLHETAKGISDAPYREKIAGRFPAKDTRSIPAFEITHGDWLKRVAKAFRDHYGDRPGAAKAAAADLECSEKTTRSWFNAETAPANILDLRAMNKVPTYAALKREIAAPESDLDPRVQAKVQELHRLTLALAGGGA